MTLRRVALIDDDSDIRRLGELALKNVGGWECVLLESAEAARSTLTGGPSGDLGTRVDVVLLDVRLGDADGVTLLGELRAAGLATPVIFLTGCVTDQDRARYDASGALGVIAKPFDPMSLAQHVRRLWAKR